MFTDAMVNAIRDGRKTMTRRPVNPQPDGVYDSRRGVVDKSSEAVGPAWWSLGGVNGCPKCKYGGIGDVIWVKEGVIKIGHERTGKNGQYLWPKITPTFTEADARRWFDQSCLYTADMKPNDPAWDEPHGTLNKMFMPRWAARIFLEITEIRVERLRTISNEDARAEGVMPGYAHEMTLAVPTGHPYNAIPLFERLWNTINKPCSRCKGQGVITAWVGSGNGENVQLDSEDCPTCEGNPSPLSWDANPLVRAITFKVLEGLKV